MKFSDFTEAIALQEGLKEQVSLAQIKEITKITLKLLALMRYSDVAKLIGRYEE